MSVDIRFADRADLPAIVAIYNASVPGHQATADLAPVSVQDREAWFAAHDPDRRPLWVAVDGTEVIGDQPLHFLRPASVGPHGGGELLRSP